MKQSPNIIALALLTLVACSRQSQVSEVVIATERPVITLDPRFDIDTQSENAVELLFNGLFRIDASSNLVPDLLESYETKDGKNYFFRLKPGVKFQDGSPLTSADVVYTFQFMADEAKASPFRSTFGQIEKVEAVDDRSVRLTLKEPNAFFMQYARRPIVPRGTAEKMGKEFAKTPIGTGPFRLVQNLDREGLVLEKFVDHFAGAPKVSRVRLRPVLDANVRVLELMKGSVDVLQNTADVFSPGSIEQLKSTPGVTVLSRPGVNVQYLNFNLHHPLFSKLAVRKAIAFAIDRQAIVKYKLSGYAELATGLLAPEHWAYEADVVKHEFDAGKSRTLLDQAGLKDPDGAGPKKRFSITYKTSTSPQAIEVAQVIRQQLEDIGIGVELRSQEFGLLLDDVKKGNFDIYTMQWTSVINPDEYYGDVFLSKSVPPAGKNRGFYANAEVDRLITQVRQTLDTSEQKKIYSRIQKILALDLPCIPLWHPQQVAAIRSRVRDFQPSARGTYDSLIGVILEN